MLRTNVVFVHGFISSPDCWKPFVDRLEHDNEFAGNGYHFACFPYPTKFLEWNPSKRIPGIAECGNFLGSFLDSQPDCEQLFLVGHSMGGLVIQSFLAQKIEAHRGADLANIRSVILFATPNRGATILSSLRGIFSLVRKNPQEEDLRVLDQSIADMSDIITRGILGAECVDVDDCPIPFRVFWGLQDDVVPEVSARGSFVEASALPGGHSEIIQCNPDSQPHPDDPEDMRYKALKSALLNPVGHPSIYEIDLFEVNLAVSPTAPETTFTLSGDVKPLTIQTDNVAIRALRIVFSKQNRCRARYDQTYWSKDGLVELLSLTQPNQASAVEKSEYYELGKKFTYVFTPDKDKTFSIKLRIYNGYGEGQRNWHNHMNVNARYKLFRFTLNLKDYQSAGYQLSQDPQICFFPQDVEDHTLCANRVGETPLAYVPSADPWLRTWEIPDIIKGGVVDLTWDVKKPAVKAL
jgi:pimeloyl-ACP methyl ester carboxylesterase